MSQYNDDEDFSVLEDNGIWLFSGEVDDDSCTDLVRWIFESNIEKNHKELTLVINSPGGYVHSGFAAVDAMNGSKIPIKTVGMGCLASMGLLMFIAGEKGKRILTPNVLIMSHQWSGGIEGKEHELIAGVKRNTLISEMVIRHYKRHTGLSTKKIHKHLLSPSDTYLSAKEAKELGLCDEIKDF